MCAAATADETRVTRRQRVPPVAASGEVVRGALVPAVDRALTLLDHLARQREPMNLARLSADLGLPKSSLHGLCCTLLQRGYLRRQDDGSFRLGPGVMGLAEAFVASTGVAEEFNALWLEAGAAPEDTVVVSVLSGREVVYVGVRHGTRPLGLAFTVGMRLPAWLAASGKAQLAYQAPLLTERLLGTEPLPPMAGAAPLPLDELMNELANVRLNGFAIDDEGVRIGVCGLGAPVFDARGQAVAGVGLCVHRTRGGDQQLDRYRDAVIATAHLLTQRIGGSAPAPADNDSATKDAS